MKYLSPLFSIKSLVSVFWASVFNEIGLCRCSVGFDPVSLIMLYSKLFAGCTCREVGDFVTEISIIWGELWYLENAACNP